MDTCGPDDDKWNFERVQNKIKDEVNAKATLVLPLATLIETGNHIAQSPNNRNVALSFCKLINEAVDNSQPWAAFSEQYSLWQPENLKNLARDWPALAATKLSIGDATIKDVANFYAEMQYHVEILTGDSGLKAYQPPTPPIVPRRRSRQ